MSTLLATRRQNCGLVEDRDDVVTLVSLLEQLPVDEDAKAGVLACVSESTRLYHGAGHLAALWKCHLRYAPAAALGDAEYVGRLIACAVAYHDLIYDSRRKDNELLSAVAWLDVATRCAVKPVEAEWVAATIRATRDHLGYTPDANAEPSLEALRLWFLDLDLSPLGETPATFRRNARRLRRESPHLSDAAWADGNLAFLRKVSAAPHIFRSPTLFKTFEMRARANIAAAIARHGRP